MSHYLTNLLKNVCNSKRNHTLHEDNTQSHANEASLREAMQYSTARYTKLSDFKKHHAVHVDSILTDENMASLRMAMKNLAVLDRFEGEDVEYCSLYWRPAAISITKTQSLGENHSQPEGTKQTIQFNFDKESWSEPFVSK